MPQRQCEPLVEYLQTIMIGEFKLEICIDLYVRRIPTHLFTIREMNVTRIPFFPASNG